MKKFISESHGYRLENSSGIFYALTVIIDGCCILTSLALRRKIFVLFRDGDMAAVFLIACNAKQYKVKWKN